MSWLHVDIQITGKHWDGEAVKIEEVLKSQISAQLHKMVMSQ